MVAQTQKFVELVTKGNSTFDLPAFNMLNVKYIVIGPQRENILPNLSAYGNAWFVQNIIKTGNAAAELEQTCSVNTRTTAVIDTSKFQVNNISPDTTATIKLIEFTPKKLKYESQSTASGLAVFSEIYYPGWVATIDAKETTVSRVNFILRALEIPAGSHTIEFTFKPKPYTIGNKVTTASSWLVLICLLGSIIWSVREARQE
jgi:hypothetical protein